MVLRISLPSISKGVRRCIVWLVWVSHFYLGIDGSIWWRAYASYFFFFGFPPSIFISILATALNGNRGRG